MDGDETAFRLPRMYSDQSGECRFDETELPLTLRDFAPPAAPLLVTADSNDASRGFRSKPATCSC
ncbi:MAG TPA: hypothetical protein VEX11_05535, partial [Acetobacteraceae bacterium]|nr:hypothetical protein [Acetobacteraceae bacterium]